MFHIPVSTKPRAEEALRNAEKRVERVKSRQIEADELSSDLREYRESNHFTDMIRNSYRRI